jgi:hypothetical protein
MANLGIIEKIDDLRQIWPHEANDFTKWLAKEENLVLLGDTIGIEINLEERESSVGNFNVDIFATEEVTGRKIIIENQLEDTNHDHLGKIITYASGKDAEVIIWIVKRARDEHKQAIEWLNQHTDEKIGFFLLEIELWRIGDSLPAPKFNIVEKPNDWAKTIKASEYLTENSKLQIEFWQGFVDYAFQKKEFAKEFKARKPLAQMWYSLAAGSSIFHIQLTVSTQKKRLGTEIYIDDDKEIFEKFKSHSKEIECDLNGKIEWVSADKACRIITYKAADIKKDSLNWEGYFEWYCDKALRLKKIINKYDI